MHLCSLAGLLKRQGPPHPSGPLLPLRSIMFAILRNGLEIGRSPLENLQPQTQSPPCHSPFGSETNPLRLKGERGASGNVPDALDNSCSQKCDSSFTSAACRWQSLEPLFSPLGEKKKWILLALKHSVKIVKEVFRSRVYTLGPDVRGGVDKYIPFVLNFPCACTGRWLFVCLHWTL